MERYKIDFIKFLVEADSLKFGEFTLKSGRVAPYFLNVGCFYTGERINKLAEFYAQSFLDNNMEAEVVFGPAYKGIPLATATVGILHSKHNKDISYCFNRKKLKEYGQKDNLVGASLNEETKLVLIDDVITAGTAIREVVELLKGYGNPKINGILISLDRMEKNNDGNNAIKQLEEEFNTKVHSIVNMDEVIEVLYNKEINGKVYIDDEKKRIIDEYRAIHGIDSTNIQQKINKIQEKNNSLVCIGLDSDIDKIPKHLRTRENIQFEFNKQIIDSTHNLVCAYKPNTAFYEARGEQGIKELKMTCDYLKQKYPEILIILDAKRADIGNTNHGYCKFAFDYLDTDAITIHPYLGHEAIKPFLDYKDKGCIILCRTSNPGAGEFQDLQINGKPYYQVVAEKVNDEWNQNNNCMMVIGATYPDELKKIRNIAPEMTFLIPGIGTQGGDVEKTVRAGINNNKAGMIISSSRGIIFASNNEDFAIRAKDETEKLRQEINKYR